MSRKWLTKDQVKQLRKSCQAHAALDRQNGRWLGIRDNALIAYLLGTGVRASECRGTKINDLCLETKGGSEPYIHIRTLKRRRETTDILTIDRDLAKLLRGYLQDRGLHNKPTSPDSFLFPGRYGGRMSLIGLERSVKRIFKQAGLPDYYSVHSLRHTHGFHLYSHSNNLKLVQVRLRHSSIQTSGIYVGIKDGEESAVINGLYG